MMKQTRRKHGMHSVLSSCSISPLETVLEDSQSDLSQNEVGDHCNIHKTADWHQKAQEDSAYWRKVRAKSLAYRGSRVPSALLRNDWYLNQLFSEVVNLYKPGSLTGFPIHSRLDAHDRHLSLLRDLAPGVKINPLFPTTNRGNLFLPADQLELLNRSSKPLARLMPPKRKSGDAAKSDRPKRATTSRKDPFNNEEHLFSAKSKLIKEDIVALFATPEAWSCLDEEQKDELRALLPPDIPYDETGAPDQSYLRYDNDWRNQLRLFQEDLANGYYEPEWIAQAEAASEARRRGEFDAWKEEQFEEYWGQKSEAHAEIVHGESLKIRLGEMISSGLFQVGDVFAYTRHFGRHGPRQAFLVEKDCVLVEIIGTSLTFVLSPGTQRRVKAVIKSLSGSPSVPQLKVEVERRSFSDDTSLLRHRFPSTDRNSRPRSQSLESPSRRHSADLRRPVSSDRQAKQEAENSGTKKPGLLERLGSLSRRSSIDKVKDQESNSSRSGGFFKIKRKPPGPKMMIVNNPIEGDGADEAFSDSTLSELSDSEFQGPAPWLKERSKSSSLSPKRKPLPPTRTRSREQTPVTSSTAVTQITESLGKEDEDTSSNKGLHRRPLPARYLANRPDQAQPENSELSRRPSAHGSTSSDSPFESITPLTSRTSRSRKNVSLSTTDVVPANKKQKASTYVQKHRQQQRMHQSEAASNAKARDNTRPAHNTTTGTDAVASKTTKQATDESSGSGFDVFDAEAAEEQGLIVVAGINWLNALETSVLRIDGRQDGEPRSDAWRGFRCHRGEKDLGSLSDMRDEYYKKKNRIL